MRYATIIVLMLIAMWGCASDANTEADSRDNISKADSNAAAIHSKHAPIHQAGIGDSATADTPAVATSYSNKRFKEVTVKRLGANKFHIKGKGQIFEASFGWYIEDGHDELKTGFATTDAGAPEWGYFDFIIDSVVKRRSNSTLHLVLFETSAMDGSRQHELPVLLY